MNFQSSYFYILLVYISNRPEKKSSHISVIPLLVSITVCCMKRTLKTHIEISYLNVFIFYIININGINFIFRSRKLGFIKRAPTRTDQEPIRTQQEPTRNRPGINQNHARTQQETRSLLLQFIPTRDFSCICLHQQQNFCFYFFMWIKEVESVSDSQNSIFVSYFHQPDQVRCHND